MKHSTIICSRLFYILLLSILLAFWVKRIVVLKLARAILFKEQQSCECIHPLLWDIILQNPPITGTWARRDP